MSQDADKYGGTDSIKKDFTPEMDRNKQAARIGTLKNEIFTPDFC